MSGPVGHDGLTSWFVFSATTKKNQIQKIDLIIFIFDQRTTYFDLSIGCFGMWAMMI